MNGPHPDPMTVAESVSGCSQARPTDSVQTVLLRWSLVVSLAAAPSFFWGFMASGGQVAGMLLGVLLFVAAYTWCDLKTAGTAWRQSPPIRRTMVATYGIRIAMTLIFPVGGYVDMVSGIGAIWLVEAVSGELMTLEDWNFATTLLVTLLQGSLLNIMLLMIGLVLLPIITLATRGRP